MTTATQAKRREDAPEPAPRRWTRDEYYRAGSTGVFDPGEQLELIEGEIFAKMSPVGSPHRFAVFQTLHALEAAFGEGFYVVAQAPLTLSDLSEPEPDVLVAVGTAYDYQERHPGPGDTRLVVEVSDTTLAFDRGRKARLYASAGIVEYWIVDVAGRNVNVLRDPSPAGYHSSLTVSETESLAPISAPGATQIAVADLLPRLRRDA